MKTIQKLVWEVCDSKGHLKDSKLHRTLEGLREAVNEFQQIPFLFL